MVSFEIFVKSMPPSLSELKVIPSFCFAFKIPDDVTATNKHQGTLIQQLRRVVGLVNCSRTRKSPDARKDELLRDVLVGGSNFALGMQMQL